MRAESDVIQDKRRAPPGADKPLPQRRVRRSRRRAWLVLTSVALLAFASYWMLRADLAPTAKPLFATVEYGDIENAVTAAGTLQPSKFVDVGAQVSGQLDKLFVEVGDVVSAGDQVAEIDATVQINRVEASRASLRALEAQLSAREAALKLAEANAERQARLMAEDATSQSAYDNAINALASAQSGLVQLQSNIAQSRASLASDEATLGYSKIYAPISGTVVTIDKKEGMTLNATQQAPVIMRIADLTTMTVQAEVSEADVSKLRAGMEVYFTTLGSGGRRWYGKLRQILPTPVVENNVVLYTALFDVDNSDNALLSDMTAQIFFVTASARNVLKVPVGAVTYASGSGRPASAAQTFAMGRGAGAAGGERRAARPVDRTAAMSGQDRARPDRPGVPATVMVVTGANDRTEVREVMIGVTSRISAEVLSGLQEGDRVVAGVVQARTNGQDTPQDRPPGFR